MEAEQNTKQINAILILFSGDVLEETLSAGLAALEKETNVHKRSSSDAGVSYNVRANRDRRARRKELGFQIIDQQGVSLADGRTKNIQSVLVSTEIFKR